MRRATRSVSGIAVAIGALSLALALALGCTRDPKDHARAEPSLALPPAQAASPSDAISTVDVPGDTPVVVVVGQPDVRRAIVHLHGMCDDPRGNLEAWGGVAQEHGTVIALVGDVPCPGRNGRSKWSDDAEKTDGRIQAAIAAVNAARGTALDPNEIVLVGESMGAARAESLAKAVPERYARLVLVGSPQVVAPANVRGARAIANLAGEREGQQLAKQATRALSQAGVPSEFLELTGASHGEYGPEGERIMSEAIAFVASR